MKRLLFTLLSATLVLAIYTVSSKAASQLEFKGELAGGYSFSGPKKITVSIEVRNAGDEDMPGPVELYFPNLEQVEDFGSPTLASGSRRNWVGTWQVTQAELDSGTIDFYVRYPVKDEVSGELKYKSKKLSFKISYTGPDPELDIKRSFLPAVANKNQEVSVIYEITNVGTAEVNNVTIRENTEISATDGVIKSIASGEAGKYVFTAKMGTKDLTSEATINYSAGGKNYTTKVEPATVKYSIIWSCPECGKTGNTGNYCGKCAYPAPWMKEDVSKTSEEREAKGEELSDFNPLKTTVQDPFADNSAKWTEIPVVSSNEQDHWQVFDLSGLPLLNTFSVIIRTRTELMNNGMLLLNEWHPRPDDFDDSKVISIDKYLGNNKIQTKDYNVSLFSNASDALVEAITAAKADGMEHYLVEEGYRSWETQNLYFQNRMQMLSSQYSGDALIAETKKDVSYPGTSEFNSGLAFTLRLYDKTNPEVAKLRYSTTAQGKWMNENCWKYGLVFRYPLAGWPLETTRDKSLATGVATKLNMYRFVGKGNAAAMHLLDLCMEEYIEFLYDHPHIALYKDEVLKYEIYRQYVGEADSFNILVAQNADYYVSSLDNMGYVITVFEYNHI